MRIATFNVQSFFERAKALSQPNWSEGRPALEAFSALNSLLERPTYTDAAKQRIVKLLGALDMTTIMLPSAASSTWLRIRP